MGANTSGTTRAVKRVESLRKFLAKTSYKSVVAICLFFPLPRILVLAMLEMARPTAGTKANCAFSIRRVMTMVLLAPGAMSNFRFFLEMNITRLASLTIGSIRAV